MSRYVCGKHLNYSRHTVYTTACVKTVWLISNRATRRLRKEGTLYVRSSMLNSGPTINKDNRFRNPLWCRRVARIRACI